jgi:hypothetical protein
MQRQYWGSAHRRAIKDARNALWIETNERFLIALLVSIIALALIWLFGGREIADHELIVQIALTAAVIIAFPLVYCWKFATAPAKMQAEADARIKQLERTCAVLTVGGPNVYKDPRYLNQSRWRMKVHNAGPATAVNVQMKLRGAKIGPKDPNWGSDFPYPIPTVGSTLDTRERQINVNDDEDYEVIWGWKSEGGPLLTSLNTKGGGYNHIQIFPDERWELWYELTAQNAASITFELQIFVEVDEVKVVSIPQ